MTFDPSRDLTIGRIIRAPRAAVWRAWTDPERFAQWWLPAPTIGRVVTMHVVPGGALETEMSEDGGPFVPHLSACYLAVEPESRLVFTNALTGGWRPAEHPFITAVITFRDHPDGTDYAAHVMHANAPDRARHEELGFHDGWGTVTAQLAALVEQG